MQLTGPQALKEGLVPQAAGHQVRPASVDLHVGSVVINGKQYTTAVDIRPQQMFIIISQERVQLKAGFVGYAMPKTSLCNEGILCLNTGILDPGYQGLISTTAINFEEDSYTISPGDAFLRLVFHRLDGEGAATAVQTDISMPDATYVKEARAHSKRFPETFLNIPGQVESIADRVLKRQNTWTVLILTIFTVIFALWNLGAFSLLGRQVSDVSQARPEVDQLQSQLDSARADVRALRAAICAALPPLAAVATDSARRAQSVVTLRAAGCP